MAENLDLLGDPIPANWGGKGRPPHIPTSKNRNKVILLLAVGWDEAKVAAAIGITRPTLRKHYFRELKVRDEARARLEGELLHSMAGKALLGDAAAYREVRRLLDKLDLKELDEGFRQTPAEPKPERLGKKAERQAEAEALDPGPYSPGAPPLLVKH